MLQNRIIEHRRIILTKQNSLEIKFITNNQKKGIMEIFIAIVSLVAAILQIILFFKVWGMTNDIRELKKDHFASAGFEDAAKLRAYLCECVVLDDRANLRRALLQDFIDSINNKSGSYKSAYLTDGHRSMSVDITPEVELLKNLFAKVNMEVPEAILNMKTYGDFYQYFKLSELTTQK